MREPKRTEPPEPVREASKPYLDLQASQETLFCELQTGKFVPPRMRQSRDPNLL